MAHESSTYRKLPGKKKHFLFGVHRLWLGKDHLLQVFSRMGIEDYQRFYFEDIQSIVTRKTAAGKVYNAMLAAVSLSMGLIAAGLDGAASAFFIGAGCFFLAAMVFNWVLGPTCRTHLRTAVQEETLPSLHRLKNARRVMDRLRVLIIARQGEITPAQLSGRPQIYNRPSSTRSRPPVKRQVSAGAAPTAPAAHRSGIGTLLAALLLARAALAVIRYDDNTFGLTLLDIGLFLGVAISGVVFLVRQYEGARRPVMLAAAWATVGYVGLAVTVGYVLMMGLLFTNPGTATSQWVIIQQMAGLSVRDNPWLMGSHLFFVVLGVVLAATILLGSRGSRNPQRPRRSGTGSGVSSRANSTRRV